MTNNELLLAIANMMDIKLKPVHNRLDKIESALENNVLPRLRKIELTLENNVLPRLDKIEFTLEKNIFPRLEKVELSQKKIEQTLENNILPRLTKIELTQENDILPRLQNIEECYVSTYTRYQSGVEKIETMQGDIDVIKSVVMGHSEKLQKLA